LSFCPDRKLAHCQIREVCDVCALWFYTSTCIAHNEIKKSVPPAKKKFIKKKEKSLGVRRSMAFWGGGRVRGWVIIASSFYCRRDRVRLFGGFPESGWLVACMTLNAGHL
jgi:hypothetical protein